ncbi:MAG: HAD family phosphatase [Lachnospiraceae bacterium]|nr:HAD family phosphatase [Lachnospiraceae bacterium]
MKTVIFDIGNVLVDWDWMGYVNRLFDDPKAIEALNRGYWQNELWREMDRGAIDQETIHRELLKSAGEYKEEMQIAYDRLGECISRFDYAKPWIKELQGKGLKVLFLSNYSQYLIDKNPDALDFTKLCDGGIFSCHVKLIKPDLAIYDLICKRYDLDPKECLFIDDKLINVIAAREYGMQAIQFTGYEEIKPLVDEMI